MTSEPHFPERIGLFGAGDRHQRKLPMRVFAGIDWGGKSHLLPVVDGDGRTFSSRRFGHGVAGIADLIRLLDGHRARLEGVAIERAEGL